MLLPFLGKGVTTGESRNNPYRKERISGANLQILDGKNALHSLMERVDSGDVTAMYHLARLYDRGYVTPSDTIPQDSLRAMELYSKAAHSGYPAAENIYGYRLYNGLGVKRNIPKGIEWIEKAAIGGDMTAINNLGWLLLEGEGVEHDAVKAAYWLGRSAAEGVPASMSMLADLYRRGEGVGAPDTIQALSLYNRALELGLQDAGLKILSMMGNEWSRLPVEEKVAVGRYYYPSLSPVIGVTLFEQAAQENDVEAMALMGDALSRGLGVAYNHDKSIEYYFRAAEKGHPSAQFVIAELLEMFPDALNHLTDSSEYRNPEFWYDQARRGGVRTAEEATRKLLNS